MSQYGRWQVTLSEDQITNVRGDARFHRTLTIGRIVNSLRFAEGAIFDRQNDDTPTGNRQRAAAFLYICALLDEALTFLDRLGQHFRHLTAFKDDVVSLLKGEMVERLRSGLFSRLRNQAIYHHDDDVMPAGLATLRAPTYTPPSGATGRKLDVFIRWPTTR